MMINDNAGDRMIALEDQSSPEESEAEEPQTVEAEDEYPGGEASETKDWTNSYRKEEWEEGPPRVRVDADEPEPRRRLRLKNATPEEIAREHAEMLLELSYEAHDFACDYFIRARGVDDRVAARSRKLATAMKLAGLTAHLIAASNKHRKDTKGE